MWSPIAFISRCFSSGSREPAAPYPFRETKKRPKAIRSSYGLNGKPAKRRKARGSRNGFWIERTQPHLSYIYADIDRSDPRVKAVYDWLLKNFTLDENPGMGAQGLYYSYHTMAKALSAYGVDKLSIEGGSEIDWRRALALRLFDLQKPDGSWVNENGRWWEKDPVLVTSYACLTLEIIYKGL